MQDKKELGKKIWDLFSKNYTYSQIAKELNISKSVVSNVINYTLPPYKWCNENIKKIKEQYTKEKERELLELKEYCNNLLKKNRKNIIFNNSIIVFILLNIIFLIDNNFIINFINILHLKNNTLTQDVLSILTAFLISVIFAITALLIGTKDEI